MTQENLANCDINATFVIYISTDLLAMKRHTFVNKRET